MRTCARWRPRSSQYRSRSRAWRRRWRMPDMSTRRSFLGGALGAAGLAAAQLTVTVGFGPSLFDDRFGFRDRRPSALADIPALPGDALDPGRSNGDLGVQACANDPQVVFHVIRNFARLARGTAVMRW